MQAGSARCTNFCGRIRISRGSAISSAAGFPRHVYRHIFARTSWDDDATWLGYFEGHLQLFRMEKFNRCGRVRRSSR